MSKEIVMAGVRYNNKVYDGFNHGECFKKLPTEANMVNVEQGFITNDGEFVDRKKAFTIARKAHQLEYDYGIQKTLISEDIHINWLHKKDQKIADLETKLAESEKRIELADCIIKQYADKDKNLYLQLAEKDKEYQSFKKIADENVNYLKNRILEETRNYNKDKISFCIEQLEKVIKFINEKYQYILELEKQGNLTEHGKGSKLTNEIVLQKLHNQIKELKKEMK